MNIYFISTRADTGVCFNLTESENSTKKWQEMLEKGWNCHMGNGKVTTVYSIRFTVDRKVSDTPLRAATNMQMQYTIQWSGAHWVSLHWADVSTHQMSHELMSWWTRDKMLMSKCGGNTGRNITAHCAALPTSPPPARSFVFSTHTYSGGKIIDTPSSA